VKFKYDRNNFMAPWTISTPGSDTVDLKFAPFFEKKSKLNLIVLKTDGHQMFGKFTGTVKIESRTIDFNDFTGWAEESISLW